MDNISNILIKIKNANLSYKPTVSFPHSSLAAALVETLSKAGYVGASTHKGKKLKSIEVELKYENEMPKISGVKRLSGQAKRVYAKVHDLKKVRNGYGTLIVSTPKGIMDGESARKEKLGGELLCEIW